VNTGFGVIEMDSSRRYRAVDFGAIRPPRLAKLEQRLLCIYQGLADVITRNRPERVAVEGIYQAKNVRSALTLGHARGAVLLAAASAELPLCTFAPSTVKAHVTGYGLADKQQVSWMVSRLLRLPTDLPAGDAADALALALCGADLPSEPEPAASR
jgi:crossover junction endodeoxyribonuclease RuvC